MFSGRRAHRVHRAGKRARRTCPRGNARGTARGAPELPASSIPPLGQLFGLPLVVDEEGAPECSVVVFRAFGPSDYTSVEPQRTALGCLRAQEQRSASHHSRWRLVELPSGESNGVSQTDARSRRQGRGKQTRRGVMTGSSLATPFRAVPPDCVPSTRACDRRGIAQLWAPPPGPPPPAVAICSQRPPRATSPGSAACCARASRCRADLVAVAPAPERAVGADRAGVLMARRDRHPVRTLSDAQRRPLVGAGAADAELRVAISAPAPERPVLSDPQLWKLPSETTCQSWKQAPDCVGSTSCGAPASSDPRGLPRRSRPESL